MVNFGPPTKKYIKYLKKLNYFGRGVCVSRRLFIINIMWLRSGLLVNFC